jgi:CubicO group peptidase (beta-lactamase class C family)
MQLSTLGCSAFLVSPRFLSRTIPDGPTAEEKNQMSTFANEFLQEFDVPGISVAIAHKGKLAYKEAFGEADYRYHETLTPSHRFRIASVSKSITSTAIFTLVQEGKLDPKQTVFGTNGVLEKRFTAPVGTEVADITVDHFLTHTSGGWPNDETDPMMKFKDWNPDQLISWTINHVPLAAKPGTRWVYSNFGYCVLGRVIEEVTGLPYTEYIQRAIFGPVGLTNLVLAGNTPAARAQNEVAYYGQSGENPFSVNVHRMDANGGWLTTAEDLVTFLTHLDGSYEYKILNPASLATMVKATNFDTNEANRRYARGWFVKDGAPNTWYHDGSLPGTTTALKRLSDSLCYAALTNTRRQPSALIIRRLYATVERMIEVVQAWK